MIQHKLEEIELFLNQDSYEDMIALLEKCIEENPEELTHYWYLGLAYLLQENEEAAQSIWLSVFLQGTIEEVEQWTLELIKFLEIKIQENISNNKLQNAKVIYEIIPIIDPNYHNLELLNNLIESLSYLATNLSQNKKRELAIEVYLEILNLNPEHSISWHSLALNYYYLEYYAEAEKSIKKAIELDSLFALSYHLLGLILEKMEVYPAAIKAYQQAIEKEPKFIDAYNNLGNLYLQQQQIDKAIETYTQALNVSSAKARISMFHKLGTAYKTFGNQTLASLYFGYAAYFDEQRQSAIVYFEQFLTSEIVDIQAYFIIAHCYLLLNKPLSAIAILQKALSFSVNNLSLKRLNQSILPIIYDDVEEIRFFRDRFSSLLDKLIEETNLTTFDEQQNALRCIQSITNFYLGYQGENDLEIQKKYGSYIYTIINKIYPQWCKAIPLSPLRQNLSPKKIRVGYLSRRLLEDLYLGWLKYCDKNKFEIYFYDLFEYDEYTKKTLLNARDAFKKYSDHYCSITNDIEVTCSRLISDKLDILIFPETSLDADIISLSCLRLAPIQCTTWANPITSGIPNIDYFLSSDLMEPDNGDEHYSENLVRLPNLGFSMEQPTVANSDKKRLDFQLKDNAIIYLCCQALFKYLPQYDYIFPAIAQQNKSVQFVFFDSFLGPAITECFKARIDRVFANFGLDFKQYCLFLPKLPFQDYLKVNQLADIFLDSFGWSGGITTKDAIACGLPIVTCPGTLMRARQSYGMLKMINVTETIAETEAEYIEIAVRLGLDHQWRQTIRDKMTANKHHLFNDQKCILGLETFFQDIVRKSSIITDH